MFSKTWSKTLDFYQSQINDQEKNKNLLAENRRLKEEFLYDRENSSFSFNITCCLSRPFKRFIKDFLKCSRTNKKLFAKNFDFVREQFEKSSRTILILFANYFLRFLLYLSYYSFSIIFRAFILQLNTYCVSVTIYTFVPHNIYFRQSEVLHARIK